MNWLFGQDVEFPLLNMESGEWVPATLIVPGTKTHPHKVPCGAMQHDNVNAELNSDPTDSTETFISNVRQVMKELRNVLRREVRPLTRSFMHFKLECLAGSPELLEFGCDADYNAWTGEEFKQPKPDPPTLRTAGGHFHASCPEFFVDEDNTYRAVKACDLVLGLPSVFLDAQGQRRRELYGRAGCFRAREYAKGIYGVEYRVLSNFWMARPSLVEQTIKQFRRAFELAQDAEAFNKEIAFWGGGDRITEGINSGDGAQGFRAAVRYGWQTTPFHYNPDLFLEWEV